MRQQRILIYFLAMPFLFLSCSSEQSSKNIMEEMDAGIRESNMLMQTSNKDILLAFENRMSDPKAKEKVDVWYPKAQQISRLVKEHLAFLEKCKEMIDTTGKKSAADFFSESSVTKDLYQRLSTYWQVVLAVDPKLNTELDGEVMAMNKLSMEPKDQKQLEEDYFSTADPEEINSLLSKFQNNALRTENKCLLFCLDQTTYFDHELFNRFEALVAQNAQILKAGDELEITAGMGSFNKTHKPKITIGDRVVELNNHNLAVHKFKTSKKLGKYSLPVKVEFTDEDGRPQERTFNLEYTLVEAIKKQ